MTMRSVIEYEWLTQNCAKSITRPSHRNRLEAYSHKKDKCRRASERFPLDFQAAITADVERQLKQLVAKFGEKKVREALDPLITKCKWNDWQCVANAIRRIAREK